MKTAVEWLIEEIKKHDKVFDEYYFAEIQQSLEMEKQQIIDSHMSGEGYNDKSALKSAEQYYNETYKK